MPGTSSPSFRGLKPSSSRASAAKRAVRSKDTRSELALRSALHKSGLRFRIHVKSLPGRPDIVFRAARVAVFVDGDFWHGRRWRVQRTKLLAGANSNCWVSKVRSNMLRDRAHDRRLRQEGWDVLRFWETDVLRDPVGAAATVRSRLMANKRQ